MQTPLALPSAARVHLRGSPVRAPRGTAPPRPSNRPSKPRVRAEGKRPTTAPSSNKPYPKAAVIGGGWAGFGAAWQLLKHGFDVTLLDSSPDPGGLSAGWRTANGRAVEAGCKGFWRHYGNIDALAEELGISPFTPYTSSAFYSPKGKEVEAPVLGDLPRLPTPFGRCCTRRRTSRSSPSRTESAPYPSRSTCSSTTPRWSPTLSTTTSPRETSSWGIRRTGGWARARRCTSSSSPRSCAPSCSPRPRSSQRPPRSTCCTATCWRIRTTSTCAGAKGPSRRRSSRRG